MQRQSDVVCLAAALHTCICTFAMPIVLKTRREIEMMRRAGQVACDILAKMQRGGRAGRHDAGAGRARPRRAGEGRRRSRLSKNYPTYKAGEGFPGYTCISVNEEVVHGIPGKRLLKEGDSSRSTWPCRSNGYCADTAITVAGRADQRRRSRSCWM